MKTLLFALGIVITGVIVTFGLLSALAVPKELAGSASSIFLGAIPYVHGQIDRRSKQPLPAFSKEHVVAFEGFVLPSGLVLCYAFLLGLVAFQLPGVIAGLVVRFFVGMSGADQMIQLALAMIPLQIVLCYLVARWIGIRSNSKGIWLLITVFTVLVCLEHVFRLFVSSEIRAALSANNKMVAWLQLGGGLVIWNVVGLVGFARGRKIQLRRYADYLLKKVEAGTRLTVLSLLRDEVSAIRFKPDAA
jgi:hypothetical protein